MSKKVRFSRHLPALAEALESRRLLAAQIFPGQGPTTLSDLRAVAAADFDGDGRPDLATAHTVPDTVMVALNDGLGGFGAAIAVTALASPTEMIARDFNGDGKADLAANETDGNHVAVLLGHGDGTFDAPIRAKVGSGPAFLTSGDINADGKLDLVVANSTSDSVSVLLGNGDGSFAAAAAVPVGPTPFSVALGDFDADGTTDLVTANYGGTTLSIASGNGAGGFSPAKSVALSSRPNSLVTGNFNGDPFTDIAVAVRPVTGESGRVLVLLGNGEGAFATSSLLMNTYPTGLVATDLNSDGRIDLVANVDDGCAIQLGTGSGTFTDAPNIRPKLTSTEAVAADFNGDGSVDLAIGQNYTLSSVAIFSGQGDGTFFTATNWGPGTSQNIISADFNADGKADLASTASSYAGGIPQGASIAFGNGDGTYWSSTNVAVGANSTSVATGDFNGDGRPDLATTSSSTSDSNYSNRVSFALNQGNGKFGVATYLPAVAGSKPALVITADFNNDGKSDMAVANNGNQTVSILLSTGTSFATPLNLPVNFRPKALVSADFDGDGKADLAVTTDTGVQLLLGSGTGTFAAAVTVYSALANALAVGDFNGDGRTDLVIADAAYAGVVMLIGNGDATFGAPFRITYGANVQSLSVGDFNGDFKTDLAAANRGSFSLFIVVGNGDGTFAPATSVPMGYLPVSVITADFNNDARPDLAVGSFDSLAVLPNRQAGVSVLGIAPKFIGTAGPVTIESTGGVLSVTTPAITVPVPIAGVSGVVLSGVDTTFVNDLGPATGNGTISLTVNGDASAAFASSQHLRSLTVNGNVEMVAGGRTLLRTTALALGAAARLDLNDNPMIYDYTTAAAQQSAVNALIGAARAAGAWNGPGLTSTAARNNVAATSTLGLMEGSSYQSLNGAAAKFAGESIDRTALLVRYTLYGDTDLDGSVTMTDFNRLATNFGVNAGMTWLTGDFNNDSRVGIDDFNLLAIVFGKSL